MIAKGTPGKTRRLKRRINPIEIPGVCSLEEFREILEEECAYVNRNSHRLSLIVLTSEKSYKDGLSALYAASIACREYSYHEIGWLTPYSIGVALPHIDIDIASKHADKILRDLHSMKKHLKCSVHTYPANWWFNNKDVSERVTKTEEPLRIQSTEANGFSPSVGIPIQPPSIGREVMFSAGSLLITATLSPIMLFTSVIGKIVRGMLASSEMPKEIPFISRRGIMDLDGIHPPEALTSIIERECISVNSNNHEFSLIVFDLEGYKIDDRSALRMTRLFLRRVRFIDKVGFLDENHLGIILPYTDMDGGRKLVSDFLQGLSFLGPPPKCTVYNYPTSWWSENKYIGKQLSRFRVYSNGKKLNGLDLSMGIEYSPGPDNGTDEKKATHIPVFNKPVRRLEPLITNRIPKWKRAIDIMGSLAGLVLCSPLLLFAYAIIKATSPGSVVFKQKRVGYMGRPFNLLKFRTMKMNNDSSGHEKYLKELIHSHRGTDKKNPMVKMDSDPRIIPLGKFLRKTCIDELPQLVNVLRGEMSLVGPRPCLGYEAQEYLLWNTQRFNTVPGMTGLWQVMGKNNLSFEEMVRLDITYTRKKSFWLDLKIILMTPLAIIKQIRPSESKTKDKNTLLKRIKKYA